jgi:glucose-1-phosphate adenylyltransferase
MGINGKTGGAGHGGHIRRPLGRRCILKKFVVDKECHLPAGAVIGIDLVADKNRFRVTDLGITLVTQEMLGQTERGIR